MAHLNCPTCYQGVWYDQWGNVCDPQCSNSNLSLNITPGGYPVNPMWMGTWHGPPPSAMGMYPYPVPCHMHHEGQSRAGSPPHSIKSRKSYASKASRRKYRDDEDSDDEFEDRRSIRSDRKLLSSGRHVERPRSLRDSSSMPRDMRRRAPVERVERTSAPRSRRTVPALSSSDEDVYPIEINEINKDNTVLEEMEEENPIRVEDFLEKTNEVPEVPVGKWECEHCTFVNEAGTRVCLVCCKTPTTNAVKLVQNSPRSARKQSAPAVLRQNSASNAKSAEPQLLQRSRSSDDYSKDYSETESVLNKLEKQLNLADSEVQKASVNVKNKKINEVADQKKGRTSRKISFWPGTKFSPLQTK